MPKQLVTGRLATPGQWGLNLQRKADILQAGWASVANNCVFDDSGRLASRKGYQRINATAITESPFDDPSDVQAVHEYIDGTGSSCIIVAAGQYLYRQNGDAFDDISGTATTPSNGNWKFQNFNGKCIGFQTGHAPIVMTTTTGSFADIALTGTQTPTNAVHEVLAAFGRLWVIDGTDLKYSDSLDESTWNGVFDLTTVFLSGMDIGTALAEFNGHLVVFAQDSIVVYTNPWVPTGGGGIDTSGMQLVETIGNTGCIARDTVQHVGKDILFLSRQGVRSLGRTVREKSMPLTDVSRNVVDDLMALITSESWENLKAIYSKKEGFYLLSLPTSDKCFYFDARFPLEDGSYRCTIWDLSFNGLGVDENDNVYLGSAGYLNKYVDYLDARDSDGTGGTPYEMEYNSGWNDLSQISPEIASLLKFPKTGNFLILGGGGQTAVVKWAFDFEDTFLSFQKDISTTGSAEYNIAEYNVDEYSGGLVFNRVRAPMRKSGQVVKVGFSTTINGATVALQQLDMNLKLGRIAA